MRYIDPNRPYFTHRKKRGIWGILENLSPFKKGVLGFFLLFLFVFALFFSAKRLALGPGILFTFLNPSGSLKEDFGRTNILLLGTGGEGHQGVNLSDTIILASISPDEKDIALISIPRDLWAPSISAKINSAYAFGEDREKGEGLKLAKKTVSEFLGLPVHYAFRIDFSGFEKAVDLVGGVDIEVGHTFDDYNFPIEGKEDDLCGYTITEIEEDGVKKQVIIDATGSAVLSENPFSCRYEYVHFDKGFTHMDGKTALKFVRSRMGTNSEGSDFARSARQQLLLLALKGKVFSLETILDPKRAISLAQTFGKSVDTDITDEEATSFLKMIRQLEDAEIRAFVLSNQKEGALLENPPSSSYSGQWVLVPRGGDEQLIKDAVKSFLDQGRKEN